MILVFGLILSVGIGSPFLFVFGQTGLESPSGILSMVSAVKRVPLKNGLSLIMGIRFSNCPAKRGRMSLKP